MHLIVFLIVGGVIGWVASIIMRTDAQQGAIMNVVVGIVGSMLGGWLIAPLVGIGSITSQGTFNFAVLGVSLAGTVVLLALWNLFQRGSVR